MSLPINQATLYNITIPSTGKTVRFRQFLVKEQKALLLAQQSNDELVMLDTLKNIIKECVKDPIDVDKLATFDIEYLFVIMRSKSVGENVEIVLRCPDCSDNKDSKIVMNVDLASLEVHKNPDHNNKIPLFDDVGIVMKYPSFNTLKAIRTSNVNDPFEAINIIIECIDFIYNTENVYYPEDVTKEELIEFIDNLTDKQMNDIKTFFKTMPRLYKDISFTCPVCGKTYVKRLEGLESFF